MCVCKYARAWASACTCVNEGMCLNEGTCPGGEDAAVELYVGLHVCTMLPHSQGARLFGQRAAFCQATKKNKHKQLELPSHVSNLVALQMGKDWGGG